MTAATLLRNLEEVRETAPGQWLARCPAHEDRRPRLSIRELDDCTLLIKCFAGCAAPDIVAAVGLELRDLFPARLNHHRAPTRSRIPASDVLNAINHEAYVVDVVASDLIEHREIDEATWQRLALAVSRIRGAA